MGLSGMDDGARLHPPCKEESPTALGMPRRLGAGKGYSESVAVGATGHPAPPHARGPP